jgi:hypothetical protein
MLEESINGLTVRITVYSKPHGMAGYNGYIHIACGADF